MAKEIVVTHQNDKNSLWRVIKILKIKNGLKPVAMNSMSLMQFVKLRAFNIVSKLQPRYNTNPVTVNLNVAGKEMLERQIYQMIWAFCAAANFLEDYPLNNKKELCIETQKLVLEEAA